MNCESFFFAKSKLDDSTCEIQLEQKSNWCKKQFQTDCTNTFGADVWKIHLIIQFHLWSINLYGNYAVIKRTLNIFSHLSNISKKQRITVNSWWTWFLFSSFFMFYINFLPLIILTFLFTEWYFKKIMRKNVLKYSKQQEEGERKKEAFWLNYVNHFLISVYSRNGQKSIMGWTLLIVIKTNTRWNKDVFDSSFKNRF